MERFRCAAKDAFPAFLYSERDSRLANPNMQHAVRDTSNAPREGCVRSTWNIRLLIDPVGSGLSRVCRGGKRLVEPFCALWDHDDLAVAAFSLAHRRDIAPLL